MDPLVKRYKRGLGGTWGWIMASSGLTTASPGCPLGDIPATLLLCVSTGSPRKTRYRRTRWPEGEGRARLCHRSHPSVFQLCSGLGMLEFSPDPPPLHRVKLDRPERGATPGRRAEPACRVGRGKVAPWASWGHGGPWERGAPLAHRDLQAALGCQDPRG